MPDPRYVFQEVYYEAITPLHVGSGQDVGIVDLPVIRERTTDYPFLPGSGIRGALRERCEAEDRDATRRLFGSEPEAELAAGCTVVLDAHLLLFPVRSAPGVFRWITSRFSLRRWRDLRGYLLGAAGRVPVPEADLAEGCYLGGAGRGGGTLYLEEYPFQQGSGGTWSWPDGVLSIGSGDVVLLSDGDFLHFARHATLVRQRNRLTTAKTVLGGHLFSMESVPAETRFVGFLGATRERAEGEELTGREGEGRPATQRFSARQGVAELRRLLTKPSEGSVAHLTLGGDESVGLGMTRMVWEELAPLNQGEG
jgi:CRISPR-associated protein Cmr4